MKIAIFSDAHDNIWNLKAALSAIHDCDALLYCGDLCSPFIIPLMAQRFSKDIHIVFGNNDGDTYRITQNAAGFPQVHLYGEVFKKVMDGKSFAMNHYPEIATELAKTGEFDVVCYGHDHLRHESRSGKTLLVNPGTLMGYNPKPPGGTPPEDVVPTFAIYDTGTNATAWYEVHAPDKPELIVRVTNKPG